MKSVLPYRHKKIKIFDDTISITSVFKKNPIAIQRLEILNAGKINHKILGTFKVIQGNNSRHSIKCYILTDLQFAEFAEFIHVNHPSLFSDSTGTLGNPTSVLYSSVEGLSEGTFEIQMNKENVLYFILDNRFSKLTGKDVQLTISEEWDETIESLDVVTTIPPDDTSLSDDVKRLLANAKNELKIITPHIDMFLIKDLLSSHDGKVEIKIITRGRNNFSKSGKEAFDYINDKLGKNHKINDYIHSRLIIRDDLEAIVSSADFNQDSMLSQYNAGILLSSPATIQKLVNFFNQVWIDSKV